MKTSAYNYYISYNEGIIFTNGISESMFWIELKHAGFLKKIIENPDNYKDLYAPFIERMVENGFIIEDTIDETVLIEEKYNRLRVPDEYRIMILPTYQCNLRCWYCVQDHENSWLTDENINQIKKLIIHNLNNTEIKRLHISWFGGEPLLAYDKLLELTAYCKRLCQNINKDFFCSVTTNATLLTSKRISELRVAGVSHYQITIDGEKEVHDKIKVLGKQSAFDTTLTNIAEIARHTHAVLRFNYTPETLISDKLICQIADRIPVDVRRNIRANLQEVWQTNGDEKYNISNVISLMDRFIEIGIRPSLRPFGLCYVDQKYYDCIYPSGEVGKCENGITDMKHQTLDENGICDLSTAESTHYLSTYEQDKSECKDCEYLPLCWGPCSQKRYLMIKNFGSVNCIWNKSKRENAIRDNIVNLYLNKKYENKYLKVRQLT